MANGLRKVQRGDPVLLKIDAIRRAATYWIMGWGYMWTVLILAGLIFTGVLLDHAFVLQKWERLAFFRLFVLAFSGAALAATLFPFVKRVNRLYVARRMEALQPELKNALISYLQCRDNPETPSEIKRLMQQKAVQSIHALGTDVVVDPGRYLRLSLVFGALVLAFLAYGAVSPKSAVVSVKRLLWPRAEILPPTATRLTAIEPGDMYVIVGDEPLLKVKAEGVKPSGVYAVWNGTTFDDRRVLLARKSEDQWEGTFPPILENGSYYVVARDTRSDKFGITVLPTPTVKQLELTLTAPAYTGLPVRTVTDGNLDVVTGTLVGLRATTSLPPQTGFLEFDSGRRVWLEPVDGQNVLEGQFRAMRSDAYVVRFETIRYPNGAAFKNPSPVRYRITCRDDQPPSVKLLAPPDGIRAQPSDKVTIVYSARDDFSVARVNLRYSLDGVLSPAVKIGEPRLPKVEDAAYEWNLAAIAASPGVVVTYHLEAEDTRPELPQVGRSETRRIVIAGPEAGARAAAARPAAEKEAGLLPPEQVNQQRPAEAQQDAPEAGQQTDAKLPNATEPPEHPAKEAQGEQNGTPPASEDEARRQRDAYARRVAELLGREEEPSANATGVQRSLQPGAGDQEDSREASAASNERANPEPEASAQSGTGSAAGDGTRPAEPTAAPVGEPDRQQPPVPSAGSPAEGPAGEGQRAAQRENPVSDENAAPATAGNEGERKAAGGEQSTGAKAERDGQTRQPPGPGQAGCDQGGTAGPAGQSGAGAGGERGQEAGQGQAGASAGRRAASEDAGGTQRDAEGEGAPRAGRASGGQEVGQGTGGAKPGEGTADAQQGPGQGAASGGGSAGAGGERSVAIGPGRPGGPPGGAPRPGGARGTGVAALPQPGEREGKLPQRDVDNAVDELGHMLDEDRLPPGLLKDLGTDRESLRQFVDRFRRDRQAGQNPEAAPKPEERAAAEKPGHVMGAGNEAAQDVAAKDALPTKLEKDSLRSRFEGSDERLSARYREVVNRYYKVLSEEE